MANISILDCSGVHIQRFQLQISNRMLSEEFDRIGMSAKEVAAAVAQLSAAIEHQLFIGVDYARKPDKSVAARYVREPEPSIRRAIALDGLEEP